MPEAATVATDAGLVPAGEGWFVLNLLAAAWERKGEFGVRCRVEARDARFPRFGIAMHVARPAERALSRRRDAGGLPRTRRRVPGDRRGSGAGTAPVGLSPLPAQHATRHRGSR